jgi:putative transcriptional regulator
MSPDLSIPQASFLAAGPDLLDPNFMHAVVLMCQHSGEGAYGLIINRPSEVLARDVLAGHELMKSSALRMFIGGPVSLETLQVLHRAPDHIRGGVQIAEELWIGGDLDDIGRYAASAPEEVSRNVKMFLGYSGWGAGQLEVELATGSWLPAPLATARVFQIEPKNLWRSVVRDLGPEYKALADEPPEPDWN